MINESFFFIHEGNTYEVKCEVDKRKNLYDLFIRDSHRFITMQVSPEFWEEIKTSKNAQKHLVEITIKNWG